MKYRVATITRGARFRYSVRLKMKLMIVDDHPGVRNLIYQLLATRSDAVCECNTGIEAVRLAPYFQPDFVTVDLRMPGPDGLSTARALRHAHPEAKIIIVSGFDEPELRLAAKAAGAIAYVKKENLEELRAIVLGGKPAHPPAAPRVDPATERTGELG